MDATTVARANPFAIGALALDSVQVALGHVDDVVTRIEQLVSQHGVDGLDDAANAATKDARVGAYRVGKEAQTRLEPLVTDLELPKIARGRIKNADARLEDMSWQLQNKDSPDERFIGIDLEGALRDARNAADILRKFVQ